MQAVVVLHELRPIQSAGAVKIGCIDRAAAIGVSPGGRASIGAHHLPIGVNLNSAVRARLLLQHDARAG
jgi:hypothetical protein